VKPLDTRVSENNSCLQKKNTMVRIHKSVGGKRICVHRIGAVAYAHKKKRVTPVSLFLVKFFFINLLVTLQSYNKKTNRASVEAKNLFRLKHH
jgi:hypothetical protein